MVVGAFAIAALAIVAAGGGGRAAEAIDWVGRRDPFAVGGVILVLVAAVVAISVWDRDTSDEETHDVR